MWILSLEMSFAPSSVTQIIGGLTVVFYKVNYEERGKT